MTTLPFTKDRTDCPECNFFLEKAYFIGEANVNCLTDGPIRFYLRIEGLEQPMIEAHEVGGCRIHVATIQVLLHAVNLSPDDRSCYSMPALEALRGHPDLCALVGVGTTLTAGI